jgi:4-amino-4-deoxy-L-arabinose transferase-like glycosyltransferase
VAGAYCLTRALESGSTRWLALAGSALGFAFLTKELQAFLVLPAFALVYLTAAPVPVRRRLWQLAVAGAALVASAGVVDRAGGAVARVGAPVHRRLD